MSSPLITPPTFSFFSGSGGQATGFDNSGGGTHPCFSDPSVQCDDGGDPVTPFPSPAPTWPNESPAPSSSGGSGSAWPAALAGLGQNILQDVLGYKLQSQQIKAGQYPGQTGPFGVGGVGFGGASLGNFNLGALLPWLLIGLVVIFIFKAIK